MSNTFGTRFRVASWGESPGPAVGAVVDGCPAGLRLGSEDIQRELDRRRPGQSAVTCTPCGRDSPASAYENLMANAFVAA